MKDLTRWGRDYLQVGNAMEIFRRNNVRFIAVNNGIDSEKPDTLEFAPFINIMSEWYAIFRFLHRPSCGNRQNGQKICRFRHRQCSAGYWLSAALWRSSPKRFFGSVSSYSHRRPCPRRPRKGGSKGL